MLQNSTISVFQQHLKSSPVRMTVYNSMSFCHFSERETKGDITLPNWGLFLKERICSWKTKFFSFRPDSYSEKGKNENDTVASS